MKKVYIVTSCPADGCFDIEFVSSSENRAIEVYHAIIEEKSYELLEDELALIPADEKIYIDDRWYHLIDEHGEPWARLHESELNDED